MTSRLIPPEHDAWGHALLDHLNDRDMPRPMLEVEDVDTSPAMHPEWFFRTFEQWDWWDRELLSRIERGPVLDLGAGAGRASLYFQERGLDVTAIDSSPGAVEVCRARGVRDVRLADVNDPPTDKPWGAILLLCGNLGLGGSSDGNKRLLTRLAEISATDAVLVGDTVEAGDRAEVRLRIRYKDAITPWWRQYNIPKAEILPLVGGTGWMVDTHLEEGVDHAVLLRKAGAPRATSTEWQP